MNIWIPILVAGLLTYATRLSFIVLLGRIELSPRFVRALKYVPPAVLSAIVFPELLLHSGRLDFSFGNFRLLAGVLAALVAWRTRSVLLPIAAGMAALLLLQALFQ